MLTQFAILNASPKPKPYKLSDGGGLHLLIQPQGSKLWRFRYRFGGKENMLSLGSFPEVSLTSAREQRDQARKLVAADIDPSKQRQTEKIEAATSALNTFGVCAEDYLQRLQDSGRAQITIAKNRWLLEVLAAPLTPRPIKEITPAEVLVILKKVEKSGRRETAKRLRGTIGSVFRNAILNQKADNDPTFALKGALLPPIVKHHAAITDERDLGGLMVSIDEYTGWPTVRGALLLMALTMCRPGDVRNMRKTEINFPRALWKIPAERMKMKRPHEIPLSRQAILVLQDLWPLSGPELVLPSIRSSVKALSENAMNSAIRRMGYTQDEHTAHGFRSSASTILNERGYNPDWIEAALAHQDEDEVRRAYNRSLYLTERTKMMQEWADLLDHFRTLPQRAVA